MDSFINSMVDQYDRGRLSRRQLITTLTGFAAVMAGAGPGAGAAVHPGAVPVPGAAESTFQATSLNHIALSVTDVGRSRDFYVKHLGLKVTRDGRSSCFLNVGPHFLALFRARQAGLNHYCYTIKGYTADSAVETLRAAGFVSRRAENRVYFDDPDGLEVQLSAPNG